jgi:hypothetical protein
VSQVTFTRTRQSIGSQLREALDDMVARGILTAWKNIDGTSYAVAFGQTLSTPMNPGRAMDFVNDYGYDVRFGKS